jgi:hypothetical protein
MSENSNRLGQDINIPFSFRRKPMPIAAELRPNWKVSMLLLILQISSHGGKSSLKRLHLLNWATRSARFRLEFDQSRSNPLPLFGFNVRFEPAFSRAIDLAVGEQLVSWVGGNRLQLTPRGRRWVAEILEDESLMRPERDFLSRVGKSLTEPEAEQMLRSKRDW